MAEARKPRKSRGTNRKPASAGKAAPARATPSASKKDEPHPVEWVIGAISAGLVLAVLGYLGFRGLSGDGLPPAFVTRVQAIEPAGDLFHVTVTVTNTGDETAAGVVLEAELGGEGEAGERGEIEFDYLPAGSMRQGSFVFRNDPSRGGALRLSVLGYTKP